MRLKFLYVLLIVFAVDAKAQSLKPGEWRTYTSMRLVQDVAVCCDSSYAWVATTGGAFRVSLSNPTDTILALRRTDGLSENDLTAVAADAQGNVYIGGRNGGFDIYHSNTGTINRLPDIQQSSHPAKTINAITVVGNKVYVATDYGITVYLLNVGVFGSTVTQIAQLPPEDSVRQVIDDGSFVYAATAEGVAYIASSADLQNRNKWTLIPDTVSILSLTSFHGTIYVGTAIGLYTISADKHSLVATSLPVSGPIIRVIASSDSIYALDVSGTLYSSRDGISFLSQNVSNIAGSQATAIAYAPYVRVITGTASNGICIAANNNVHAGLYPSGPVASSVEDLTFSPYTDQLYVANGIAGISIFRPINGQWQAFEAGSNSTPHADYRRAFFDSVHNAAWISTFGSSFYKVTGFDSGSPKWIQYDSSKGIPRTSNSGFTVAGTPYLTPSGDIAIPIWAMDGRGLTVSKDGNTFTSYQISVPDDRSWGVVTQDMSGNYWVSTEESSSPKSIGVYWLRTSDNAFGTIPGGSGDPLVDPFDNAVLTDQDNGIWVGTESGVQIISNPDAILQNLDPKFAVRTVKFLTGQVVRCMTVDGVGNKWVGTDDGIFVVSPDGSDSVARYTAENSPLIDNAVRALAIDPVRGEAYVGTPSGISRFATIFKRGHTDYAGIHVYPNPVVQTSEQSPLVYVDGLVAGSTVQVFTLDGKLVTTINGTSLGSTVTWNGRDALGRQVASGLYLISATSPQSGENGVAKVVIIQRP